MSQLRTGLGRQEFCPAKRFNLAREVDLNATRFWSVAWTARGGRGQTAPSTDGIVIEMGVFSLGTEWSVPFPPPAPARPRVGRRTEVRRQAEACPTLYADPDAATAHDRDGPVAGWLPHLRRLAA